MGFASTYQKKLEVTLLLKGDDRCTLYVNSEKKIETDLKQDIHISDCKRNKI
jgi:hypothetical protein